MNTTTTDPKIAATMENLTAQVIASIEAGIADPEGWKAPWHTVLAGSVNAVTKRPYSGGNALILGFMNPDAKGWATYRQWSSVGATVKRGEKGQMILIPVPVKFAKEDRDGNKKTVSFIKYRVGHVFHAGQVDGWNAPEMPVNTEPKIADADALIAAWSQIVPMGNGSNRAYYSPMEDRISIPTFDEFKSAGQYYSTAFHEIIHSTGHADRLDRGKGHAFGSTEYAKEELCAELGAAFLATHFGIQSESVSHESESYLASWLQALQGDTNFLWSAASQASRAATLVLGNGA